MTGAVLSAGDVSDSGKRRVAALLSSVVGIVQDYGCGFPLFLFFFFAGSLYWSSSFTDRNCSGHQSSLDCHCPENITHTGLVFCRPVLGLVQWDIDSPWPS